jgi:hypothetical protein
MKKLFILLTAFIYCYGCYAQPIVNRAGAANTVQDARWRALYNAGLPIYNDTIAANVQKGIDSSFNVIGTRSPKAVWYRSFSPKRWVRLIDVENFAQFVDTAQEQSITNISIINQVDSSISIQICVGTDNCDTVTYVTSVTNATSIQLITDSSVQICSVDTVSGGTVTICDTINIGVQPILYYSQNGITLVNGNIFEHGGILNHNTTLDAQYNKYFIVGRTVYDYVTTLKDEQRMQDGTGVASFWHTGNTNQPGNPDQTNLVKLGVNYVSDPYPSFSDGYMGDKIGYMINVNGTGNGPYGFGIESPNAKFGGVFFHTWDTAYKDAVTIFGSRPPGLTQAWNMQPNTMDSTRIAVFKNDKQVQLKGYGAGTRIASPTTISGWDANGNFVEVDTANLAGSITFIDSSKVIICSYGNYLCDTIFTTQGGLMSIYADNGLTKRNDSTLILGGTLDQNTVITGANFNLEADGLNNLYFGLDNQFDIEAITDGTHYSLQTMVTSSTAANNYWQVDSKGGSDGSYLGVRPTAIYTSGRFQLDIGASVAAANDLTLGTDGNLFTITGATQINAITTTNWQAGSQIAFVFTGAPTLKNNTAGGAGTATMLLAGRVDYVAAAGDYIAFQYDGTNWYETNRKLAAAGGVYIFNNGLTESPAGTVKLGGTLLANTTIATGAFSLSLTTATAAATPLIITGTTGNITHSTATSGTAGYFVAGSGFGIRAEATGSNPAGRFSLGNATTNAPIPPLSVLAYSSGSAANGFGAALDMYSEASDNSNPQAARIAAVNTDVTIGTYTSRLDFYVQNSTVLTKYFTIGHGYAQLTPITATAASAITPAEGQIVIVSDTNGTFTSIGFWGYSNGSWAKF